MKNSIYKLFILLNFITFYNNSLSQDSGFSKITQNKSNKIKICYNDKYIFIGEIDGRIRVRDINTGKLIRLLIGHTDAIQVLDLTSKGDYLISGSKDHSIRLWDVHKGIEIKKMVLPFANINEFKLSHNCKSFAIVSNDQVISIWDLETLTTLGKFSYSNTNFQSIAFTMNDEYLAVGSDQGLICLIHAKTQKLKSSWKAHANAISFLGFNASNQMISFSPKDTTLKLWNIENRRIIHQGEKNKPITTLNINHAGKFIYYMTLAGNFGVLDPNTLKILSEETNKKYFLSLISCKIDSSFIINEDDNNLKFWKVDQNGGLTSGKQLQLNNALNSFEREFRITPFQKWKHHAGVTALAVDTAGEHVLSGGGDNQLQYRKTKTGKLIHVVDLHKSAISAVGFHPSGDQLLSSDLNGRMLVSSIFQLRSTIFTENRIAIQSFASSPDGKLLALGTRDNTIKIYSFQNSNDILIRKNHTNWITALVFTKDGKNLISGSYDGTIRLWAPDSENELDIRKLPDLIRSFSYLPANEILLVATEDKIYKFMNDTKLIAKDIIQNISGKINTVAISPDGRYFIAGGTDGLVSIYNLITGRWVGRLAYHKDEITALAFCPDGKYFVSGSKDSSVCVVELKAEYLKESSDRESSPIIQLASGDTLIVEKENVAQVLCVSNSPDGKYMITGSNDNQIRLWETKTGKMIKIFSGHTGPVYALDFDKTSQYFISGGADKSIRLWKISTTTSLQEFKGHSDIIKAVHFSYNSFYIVSGSLDSTIKVWDRRNGRLLTTLKGHNDAVETVIFSKDDKLILSGSRDKTIRLWDWNNSIELNTFEGHLSTVNSIALSPTGKFFVSGGADSTVKLWDLKTGKIVKNFEGHQGEVTSVTFTNQGTSIISGSLDSTVVIWETGREKKEIISCKDAVTDLALTSDGNVFIGGKDGELSLWRLKNKKPILTLMGFRNNEWISVTPEMYYVASDNADKYIKINANDTSYSLNQYQDKFENSDQVNKSLTNQIKKINIINMKYRIPPYIFIPYFKDSYGNLCETTKSDREKVVSDTCIEIYAFAEDKNPDSKLIKYELCINDTFKVIKNIKPPSKKYDIKEKILLFPSQLNKIKIKIWNEYAFSESNILHIVHKDTSIYSAIRITENSIHCLKKNGVDKKIIEKIIEIRDVIYWGENDFIGKLRNLGINDLKLIMKIIECAEKLKKGSFDSLCNFIFSKNWAIIIGIDKYRPESGYRELNYAVKDAKAIKNCLIDSFGYADSLIFELYNEGATKDNIERIFDQLIDKIGRNDQLLLYFSGHGDVIKDGNGREKGYLIPYDGDRESLFSRCISSSRLHEFQEQINPRQLLFIVDACFSGLFGQPRYNPRGRDAERNQMVIEAIRGEKCRETLTSGRKEQESIESKDKEHGIFTYYLLKGLEGEADSNHDNIITIKELIGYLTNTVPLESKKIARKVQIPELYESHDNEGDWIFYKIMP